MSEMKIEQVKTGDLKPYKLNAKLHPQTQIDGIAESIKRFGFTQPLVIDKENNLIIGHGRLEAAKKLGMKAIPCLRLEKLTEVEIKALRLIDNRIAESGWDSEMLKLDIENIEYDFESFGVEFESLNLDLEFEQKEEKEKQLNKILEVVVKCESESHQQEVYDKLISQGFECRLLTL